MLSEQAVLLDQIRGEVESAIARAHVRAEHVALTRILGMLDAVLALGALGQHPADPST